MLILVYLFRAFFRNLYLLEKAQRFLGIPKKHGLSIESAALSPESAVQYCAFYSLAAAVTRLLLLENRHKIALYYYMY